MSSKVDPAAARRMAEKWAAVKPAGCTCYVGAFIQNGPDRDPDTMVGLGHHPGCPCPNPPGFTPA